MIAGNHDAVSRLPLTGLTVAFAESPHPFKSQKRLARPHFFVSCLQDLGCQAFYVLDGDPAALSADLLILYGNARAFYKYARLLRARPNNRPQVAVWQIDPLPPMELDRRLQASALGVPSVLAHSRLLRPIEMAATFSLFQAIADHGLGVYSDRTKGNSVDGLMARTVVEAYAFIRRARDEGWLDHVFVSTMGKERFLASRGIPSVFAPIGYHERVGEDRDQPRDVDVLFIGKLKKRARRERLGVVVKSLERIDAKVVVVERGYFGERRTALVNRTKIVLHLHKYPWDTPWMRWAMAAECGALVVSETLSDPEPLVPGEHYVEAPFDELPAVIEKVLADPARALAMARRCAELFRTRLSVGASLQTVLDAALGAGLRQSSGDAPDPVALPGTRLPGGAA